MTCHYFLRDDYETLVAQIDSITSHVVLTGKEMGASCTEGAETFHDNFAHEEGERQQRMWTRRLKELIRIRDNSRVIEPPRHRQHVCLGCSVTVTDLDNGEIRTYRIGSYMVFNGAGTVSYSSPLGRLLMGAVPGEERHGEVAGDEKSFLVLEVR